VPRHQQYMREDVDAETPGWPLRYVLNASERPCSPGHTYRACAGLDDAQLWRFSNLCTALTY